MTDIVVAIVVILIVNRVVFLMSMVRSYKRRILRGGHELTEAMDWFWENSYPSNWDPIARIVKRFLK